ncbi:MadS family sensor histidine kinase [Actinokineospora sp.]|uniref:MadS family sensor histidine kinase n=1 Tax=Actinokineospora sp. TaxID=1872133 RepID=UPI00403799DB
MTATGPDRAGEFGAITGLRSGKRSFYPEYVRSTERLARAVQALDGISRALVRNVEGPRALVEEVVRAAADHLQADWLLLAVADGALRGVRPGFLFYDVGRLVDQVELLPEEVRGQLDVLRSRSWEVELADTGPGWVRAPMILDGEPVGGIVGWPGVEVEPTDRSVLGVLANQAAVALHNSYLLHAATQLRGRTVQLSQEAARQARDLATRSAELQETQRRLMDAMGRQVLDDERHRIARELHDSVTQHVLSAGMTIEVCRADLVDLGPEAAAIAARLVPAKDLTRRAVQQLRAAIYALHHNADEPPGSLVSLLDQLSTVHLPGDLRVRVRVVGVPVALPPDTDHALLRIAGEALFNTAAHGQAAQAVVRLRFAADKVVLSIADDGSGDPARLRHMLRLASVGDFDGRHRGLVNMAGRARDLGGTLAIRRARLGGVEVRVQIPMEGAR